MKTTALSSSDTVTPRFHFINDLFDMNAPITEMVYSITPNVTLRDLGICHFITGTDVSEQLFIGHFHITLVDPAG